MAKRRFFRRAAKSVGRRARRAVSYVKSRARRSSSSSGAVKPLQIDAMAYGALRPYAVGLAAPVTNMVDNYIPTDIAEPLVMGTVAYFTAKNSSGMIKDIAKKALTCENYELGKAASNKFLGTSTQSNQSTGFVLG